MTLFSNPEDLLGYADEETIISADSDGGLVQDLIEELDHLGRYLDAVKATVRPRDEYSHTYLMLDGAALDLEFGVAVNTNYFLTGATFVQVAERVAILTVNFIKFSAATKFNSTNSVAFTVSLVGGTGVTDLLGCSVASPGEASEARLEVQTRQDGIPGASSGDYQTAGYVVFAPRLQKSLTASGAITLPVGATQARGGKRRSRDGFEQYSASWVEYPTPN